MAILADIATMATTDKRRRDVNKCHFCLSRSYTCHHNTVHSLLLDTGRLRVEVLLALAWRLEAVQEWVLAVGQEAAELVLSVGPEARDCQP